MGDGHFSREGNQIRRLTRQLHINQLTGWHCACIHTWTGHERVVLEVEVVFPSDYSVMGGWTNHHSRLLIGSPRTDPWG